MKTTEQAFLDAYERALDHGSAALFAGAGLSRPAGFVDWKGLLRPISAELGLDVDRETDLVAVAQYHVNERGGRGALNQRIVDELTKDARVTKNHELIAQLPIPVLWTTNYDTVLEEAFRGAKKRLDVKIRKEDLALHRAERDAVLYKMHGDVSAPDRAVVTKDDYETYQDERALFSTTLQGDLVGRTFLFLGFSFTDPNLDHILARIRGLMGPHRRDHYCVMKAPTPPASPAGAADFEYERRKLELRIGDLQRYGIQTVLVDDYGRITDLLAELSRRRHRRNIFVSGSAHDFAPLGQPRIEALARALGAAIITRGYNLTSGFGQGIGGTVLVGAMEAIYQLDGAHVGERVTLRPTPPDALTTLARNEMQTRYREEMVARTGFMVLIAGNKHRGGNVVKADGCEEEFAITVRRGKHPIPIGATGHVARELWEKVTASLGNYFPGKEKEVAPHFQVLGDAGRTDEELVGAVFGVVDAVVRR